MIGTDTRNAKESAWAKCINSHHSKRKVSDISTENFAIFSKAKAPI
ncbi:MAG: hypothetical protein ACI9DH_001425, partial [Halioglobus sp.]